MISIDKKIFNVLFHNLIISIGRIVNLFLSTYNVLYPKHVYKINMIVILECL